jgi:acetyl-CoA carboxylase carboxyltransferase component
MRDREREALAMGGAEKLAKRKADGLLNARERIDVLLDEGSFVESGLHAKSHRPEMFSRSNADGKIAGFGRIEGRPVALVSNDFTVLGASSSMVNGKKMKHIKDVAAQRGMPVVFLGESTGSRMPDRMGAPGRALLGQDPAEFLRDRRVPWVSALLGSCYGSSTWHACLSDFVVMRKGAVMAVASERVTSLAIGQPVDAEELGGWRLHAGTTGLVDLVVESDADALVAIQQFLSYLPSHNGESPPVIDAPDTEPDAGAIPGILPESRSQVYDSRDIIRSIVDQDSFFELKQRFGKSVVTGLSRLRGQVVGIVASNPKFKGGSIDVDACAKVTSFLVLCDSYNIPLVFLADQPGFLIGPEGEKRGAPGRIMNWINALSLVTVPKFAITMRKNYGQAYLNMGGGRNSDEVVAWPTAEYGFMDPRVGVNVLYGLREADDPERFKKLVEEIERDSSAWALAALYEAHAVIDPRETRNYVAEMLAVHSMRPSGGVGQHRLSTWPTSF